MVTTDEQGGGLPPGADLSPYLPLVQAHWLADDPSSTWREVEGTLVFADISGFTPLTERLARLGKVGAEELTATLNQVFGTLLGVAAEQGGDLLKYGGDALLLLFTGPEHAVRACAASARMQKALRAFRRYRTDAGSVSLKMSVGVASGRLHLFLVGGSHRELLVAGPVISQVATLEAAADADEVLVCAATAERLPAAHRGAGRSGGTLLVGTPATAPAPLRPPPAAGSGVLGVPVALRKHLCAGQPEGEHRVAVLTFLQFTGTDDLLAAQGPAAVAAALDELVRAVQEACERHGTTFLATDLDRNGGKVLLVAGAPAASTDDADRTLHTLVDVLAQPLTLRVRAGVNRGRAFAVDVGSSTRRTYAVMGDATNLAARVMGKAAPGTVLATANVLEHVRTDFAVTHVEPFLVKGKAHPVHAGVVGRAVGRRAGEASALPLLGRDAELTVFDAALAAARAGQGRTVEVVGEPGIGKSRLLAEVRARAGADLSTVLVEGASYTMHSSYASLRLALRGLIGVTGEATDEQVVAALQAVVTERAPDLEPWLPLLAVPVGVDVPDTPQTAELGDAFRATRLRMAVTQLLCALLTDPTLVVVEDAHWLDAASSDLLLDVLQTASQRPWLVCVTRRAVPGGLAAGSLPGTTTIALGPLPDASTYALLRQAAQEQPVAPAVVAALVERSGGNPLFLQELLAAARTTGDVDELPDSIEAVVAARIDELPVEDRALLRHASVLGMRFPAALLDEMLETGGSTQHAILERLPGFLVAHDGGSLGFRHALLREVAYETLPFRRRRVLHGRAGELIERHAGEDVEEHCDVLSLHYAAAQRHDAAWVYSRQAGDRARRLAGPADAAVFYRRAVEAAAHLPQCPPLDIARTYEALGDVYEVSAQYDKASRAYARARQVGRDDPLLVVELCRKQGWVRERSDRYSQALCWYARGLARLQALRTTPEVLDARARLRLAYGIGRLRQGRYKDAVPHLEAGAGDAAVLGDLPTLGHAYYVLDWAHTDLGSDRCHRYRSLALMIFEHLGDLHRQGNVYNNLGVDAYYEGRWDEALQMYERSRAAWERSGDVAQMGTAANNVGEILSDQGHLDQARAQFEEALYVWRAARFPVGLALATSNLGRLAVRRGDLVDGARLLAEAREAFSAIGAESFVLEVDARDAERLVLAGEGAAALPLVEATAARAEALGGMSVLLAMLDRLAGCALAQCGDRVEAVRRLRLSMSRSTADYERALTLAVLADLGEGDGEGTAAEARSAAAEVLGRLAVVRTPALPLAPPPHREAVIAGQRQAPAGSAPAVVPA